MVEHERTTKKIPTKGKYKKPRINLKHKTKISQ